MTSHDWQTHISTGHRKNKAGGIAPDTQKHQARAEVSDSKLEEFLRHGRQIAA